jgi:hypothetical protein
MGVCPCADVPLEVSCLYSSHGVSVVQRGGGGILSSNALYDRLKLFHFGGNSTSVKPDITN